jgi:glycosyltransferase involved in cell wall biosynthesis
MIYFAEGLLVKVCIVSRSLSEDYRGSFEFDQAMCLRNAGHNVYFISLDLRSLLRKRKLGISRIEEKGIKITRISIPLGAINKRVFYYVATKFFKKVFEKENHKAKGFDVVHAHFLDNIYITLKALYGAKERPIVVGTEHTDVTRIEAYKHDTFMKSVIDFSYAKVDKLITVSKSLACILKNTYDMKSDIIYNVVDTSQFRYDDNISKSDREKIVFCSVGNLTPNKRMDMLIKCFYEAFQNDDKYMLYICGGGEEYGALINLVKNFKCEKNIKLLGNVSRTKIRDVFNESDYFVLLSQKETFGVAYIEAMACGLPVMSTYSGGPEEFITEDVGILVNDNEKQIVSEMKNIASGKYCYDRKRISGYVYENFSPTVIADKLVNIYLKAIEDRK